MKQEIGATEGGRDCGAIIPSFLDDYGLDPYEMRVYIRLARRAGMGGQCWESVTNMAQACKISSQKVKNCLALLSAAHLVKQIKRPGASSLYQLLLECHWVKASELGSLRSQVTAYRTVSDQKRQQSYYQKVENQPSYEVADYGVANYEVVTTELRGSYPTTTYLPPSYEVATKESQLRNPIKDSHEGIPLTPLAPQANECEQAVPEIVKVEVVKPSTTLSSQERSEQLPSPQPTTKGRGYYSAAAGGACEKFEQGIKGRSQLPSYRTTWERDGIKQEFLNWMCLHVMASWTQYKHKTPTPYDAKNWVRNREKEGCHDLVENRYDQMLNEQAHPQVAQIIYPL